jgi:polysaccharide export outer membrane protein
MKNKKITKPTLLIIFLFALLSSCVSTRNASYFDEIGDSKIDVTLDSLEPVIHQNDLLSIAVSSPNLEATQIFNTTSTVTSNPVSNHGPAGYLVNQEGFVDFPLLGNIKAAGLTKKQFKENITRTLIQNQLLKNPTVVVRYLNYTVTVLGEVSHPMVINVPDEKMSLLEALGSAGDMTIYAKRNTVMVIREEDGKRIVKRLNLNSNELLTSPYYYLKSNDIVYVQPNKARVSAASNARGWMPLVISLMSLAAVVIYRSTR